MARRHEQQCISVNENRHVAKVLRIIDPFGSIFLTFIDISWTQILGESLKKVAHIWVSKLIFNYSYKSASVSNIKQYDNLRSESNIVRYNKVSASFYMSCLFIK